MFAKKHLAVAFVLGLAPLMVVSLPANPAQAHGWVTSPASRQDQCFNGSVECGPIKWEPDAVEGPKGLKSCSGGNAQFADLNDDGKGWAVHSITNSATFTWQLTAQHSTTTWQYFVGSQKVAEFDQGGAQPPQFVRHKVNFDGIRGQQKVLAVWNIADTANAFYACVDVNIRG
ncbi:lytic polysaccharide monooxygenase auxiliary activity family 9 protein [Streptomyces aureocirculatus]|uniref:lytic polysaccharide monooxygenase auxiliary activity family 9 protein n=1 Tax=Streptomyces aureocirculatus TaxID=67275 RepID=UPI0004C56AB9|nr:lytic polysaccharide monooxygenase auxiliary activity family 9 protein [Streptomyces aureocirculatus]